MSTISQAENRNIKLFYFIYAGMGFWLVEAVWFFYWAKFGSYADIGAIFAFLTLVWILLEIPSGALADMFGRRKSTVFGMACLFLGSVVMAGAQNLWFLVVGGVFNNIGRAFISGSLQALVYDDLKSRKLESWFDDVIAKGARIRLVVYAISTLGGGFLFTLFFRLPHSLTAIAYLVIFIGSFFLKEVVVERPPTASFRNYLLQNLEGFRQLWHPSLRRYLVPIFTVMVMFFVYDWGFSKPAMALHFGYGVQGQSIIYMLMSLLNAWVVGKLPAFRAHFGDFKGVLFLQVIIGAGFMLSALNFGYWGVLVLFMIESAGYLGDPLISTIVNRSISSQDRATTLSSVEFISKLPYIAIIFLAGQQIESDTTAGFHLGLGAVVVIIALLITGAHLMRKSGLWAKSNKSF